MEFVAYTISKCSPLEKTIFYKISSEGPLTKADLSRQLNLKHATLSRAVDALIDKGLLEQIASDKYSNVGRKPKLLAVNPTAFYLIGVDISRLYLGILLADARFQKIEYIQDELSRSTSPDFIINRIKSHVSQLLRKYSIDKKKVLGLGIGAVGKLKKDEGTVIYADNFGVDWSNVPLKKLLQKELDIPIVLENGANAAAFAEFMIGSARKCQHVLYVHIGVGIRCGVINEGRIIRNLNNIDSTYGHIVIEPSGKKCKCGNYGCLVMYSATRAIVEEYIKMCKLQNIPIPQETLETMRFENVVDFFEKGEETAAAVLTNAAVYMGIGLANIISILNPEVVVLGGPVIERNDLYYHKAVEITKSRIYKVADRNLTFTKSYFEKEATSIGICVLMVEGAFNKK